jgi:hypothetical protein
VKALDRSTARYVERDLSPVLLTVMAHCNSQELVLLWTPFAMLDNFEVL